MTNQLREWCPSCDSLMLPHLVEHEEGYKVVEYWQCVCCLHIVEEENHA